MKGCVQIHLTDEEIGFLTSLGLKLNFENLSDEDFIIIEEIVGDELQIFGFDEDYNITLIGKLCESILDKLP